MSEAPRRDPSLADTLAVGVAPLQQDGPPAAASTTVEVVARAPLSEGDPARSALAKSAAAAARDDVPSSAAITRRNASIEDEPISVSVADPLIGMVIADRYRILEPIGRGGMGIVYKVEHTRIGKLLAMKLLTGELTRSPDVVRRFKREALTASRLSSPNTVQVFDFGHADGLTYLVMELVRGDDLGRVLRTLGAMPFARLGRIVVQVCSSLAEAHENGIVHRDIKPENIMIVTAPGGTDLAKVLDFGLAKLREGAEANAVTLQGAIVGTPYFMSPEQVRGEAVDARSDIYALGAVMYRALTGAYPFQGASPVAVFLKHVGEAPVPLEVRAPELGISPGASRIVLRALAKSPADRFQRVEELREALAEELRAMGASSVEELLDSGALRRLSVAEARARVAQGAVEIATRNEVEAYERKLRRMRTTALASVAALSLATGLAGARLYALATRPRFTGVEVEPNDTAAEAEALPLGRSVSGYLGKRIDAAHGDRDFYAVDVPAEPPGAAEPGAPRPAPTVRLSLTALPNFPICAFVYRAGLPTTLGRYCVGRPGRDLLIPALRLDPGRYLVAVLQDLDAHGGPATFLHENVSDRYTLTIAPAELDPSVEVEPNDQIASANALRPGERMSGALGWSDDEDVVCAPDGAAGPIRWTVRDGAREDGVVLEATLLGGAAAGARIRIHTGVNERPARGPDDATSPWTSDAIADEGEPRCLRLRLANDVWNTARGPLEPGGSSAAYTVELHEDP